EEDVEVAEAGAVRALDLAGRVRGAHHAAHAHGDRGDGGGTFEEAASRRDGAAGDVTGEIHVLELGEMRTADAITHDGPPRASGFVLWMGKSARVGNWARTTPRR